MSGEPMLPYPGLRAYQRDETHLFFGREGCVNEMIDRLAATRFLAVLGASGSGKSSLVRTGLFDGLDLGLYPGDATDWAIADCHPGGSPLLNLARALLEASGNGTPDEIDVETLQAFLSRGPLSIAEWVAAGHLPAGARLLILVDQFEELFRYLDYAGREQAEAFVALLLESKQREPRIHVVITMRSEYLGNCALMPGLAQAINAGLYLTRRMTREECRQAIEGPASVMGFEIEPALVTRILNDLASFAPWSTDRQESQVQRLSRQSDQLPLMQHALSRLWQVAMRGAGGGPVRITLENYLAIGELGGALEQHAGEVMASLSQDENATVRKVFRALVAGQTLADAVRRPRRLEELVAITGEPRANVVAVVDAFRAPGCNFLRPPRSVALTDETFVDISHESLIRQWSSLAEWFAEEARAHALWQRLLSSEERYASGEGNLLSGLDLGNAVAWSDREKPNAAWAASHGGRHEKVTAFLETSRRIEEEEERRRKAAEEREWRWLRIRAALYLAIAFAAILGGFYFFRQSTQLENALVEARELTERADRLAAAESEARRQADEAAQRAQRNEYGMLARLSRDRSIAGDHIDAMKLALAAWPRAGDTTSPRLALTVRSMETALRGHANSLMAAPMESERPSVISGAFSGDGRFILTTTESAARLWRAEDGELLLLLPNVDAAVSAASLSPDGSRVVIAGAGGNAIVYDTATGTEVSRMRLPGGAMLGAAFSPDGARIVFATAAHSTTVFDTATGAQIAELAGHTDWIRSAVFFPDGRRVLTASDDMTARIWDAETGSLLFTLAGHEDWVRGGIVSADGRRAATWADDKKVRIYDSASGARLAVIENLGEAISSAAFHSTETRTRIVVGSHDNLARVYDADTGVELHVLSGHTDWVRSVAFSPDGTHVLTASDDRTARVFEMVGGREVGQVGGHEGWLTQAAYAPDGTRFLTTGTDGLANLWDAESYQRIVRLDDVEIAEQSTGLPVLHAFRHDQRAFTATFSPDGTRLLTSSDDRSARIWDVSANGAAADAPPTALMVLETGASVSSAVYSPDGRRVATSGFEQGEAVRIWDVTTDDPGVVLTLPTGDMWVSYSPDGSLVVTGDRTGAVEIWNAATGERVRAMSGGHQKSVWSAQFSPDGSKVASAGDDGFAIIWDVATGTMLHRLAPLGEAEGTVFSAHFSPDGSRLATADSSAALTIWQVSDGSLLQSLKRDAVSVKYARFSPDGTLIATTGENPIAGMVDSAHLVDVQIGDIRGVASGSRGFAIEFSPDGQRLAVAVSTGQVFVLDVSGVPREGLFALACRRLGADTSLEELRKRYELESIAPICGTSPPTSLDVGQLR